MWTGTAPFPGIVARVACHTNFFAVAHAKSFTRVGDEVPDEPVASRVARAVAWPGPTSSGPTIVVMRVGVEHAREPLARVRREHLLRVLQQPVPLTIQPAGTSSRTSKRPKLL